MICWFFSKSGQKLTDNHHGCKYHLRFELLVIDINSFCFKVGMKTQLQTFLENKWYLIQTDESVFVLTPARLRV